ncbi:SWIM zinc finger family protein [Trinickia dabaoshanensis]|uniref:SWIM zinc finger family protein n=1 Tax=Trinickia dabaoshanensis TaxID=564714 RepID=A0A2N7W2W5_9BURK|nr:SWIM zinc finger family protein [Trinickia dabaoshanensis]PMS23703.1 SWIM zinc finger family protein [Trinickia dabaoshanensis]
MPWFDIYRAYDDDTLTALANAGLLRRAAKDVDAGKVGWIEQEEAHGVVDADGQRVQLDTRGPQQARCDCPAPGLCKHILAAVLWLRASPAATVGPANDTARPESAMPAADSPAPTPEPSRPQVVTNDPLNEVLTLPVPALFRAAGAAAVRRAAATPAGRLEWRQQGGVLIMELPDLGQSCRWIAGAGFSGMVSDVPAAERKAVHLMALVALREVHGLAPEWPADAQPPAAEDTAALTAREQTFLTQVESTLAELLTGGLSHVSELTAARLLALNMSARGEGLPRLAALLRNLGGTVDLLVRRDHRADERDALAAMARIHALCNALRTADGALAGALRGRLRRQFAPSQTLELLPLGAHWWQTRGGARGLTLAFWDPQETRLLQATLARPDGSDQSFTRQGAWTSQAVWPGAGAAQRICEAAWRIEQPRLADDGRLALGGATRAQSEPLWHLDDPRLQDVGFYDWAELGERLRAAVGLAGEPLDTVLLRPVDTRPPRLDEVRQQVEWTVEDTSGRWLTLVVPISPEYQRRADNLDRLCARRAGVLGVLVRVERGAAETAFIPLAILSRDAKNRLQVISLDFAEESERPTSLANRILRMLESRREQAPPAAAPTLAARLLAPVYELLETQAATGRLATTASQIERAERACESIDSVGLSTVAAALLSHLRNPDAHGMLRLYRLCELLTELDGLPGIGR